MDKRTFWSTKSKLPEFHGITIDHPAFEMPFRLLANQFEVVNLGGHDYQPAPMTIDPPSQAAGSAPKLTMTFPRNVVGREFKRQLRLLVKAGGRDPISVNYSVWLGDTITPQIVWKLYVADGAGINFSADSVQVSATLDNPMRKSAGIIYDPGTFTGLTLI